MEHVNDNLNSSDQIIRRNLSDLPSDLLREIRAKLNWADQIRFACVCKNWLSLLPFEENRKSLWLLGYYRNGSQLRFKMFDPIDQNSPYDTVFKMSKIGDEYIPDAECSKHGWVFFSLRDTCIGVHSFTLFSPFTKQVIRLPGFLYRFGSKQPKPRYSSKTITFSSDNPTSKECIFIVVFYDCHDPNQGSVNVVTYQHGEQWFFHKSFACYHFIESVVYLQGILYFLYTNGRFLIYDIATRKPFEVTISRPACFKETWIKHLIESHGELLLISIDHTNYDDCRIYKFDAFRLAWVAKTSLPNQALFIGRNSLSLPAFSELEYIANNVFFYDPCTKDLKFYDLRDCKTYKLMGSAYECLFSKDKCMRLVWVECPTHIMRQSKVEYLDQCSKAREILFSRAVPLF